MFNELLEIIELTKIKEFKTDITYEQIFQAKEIIKKAPESSQHLFLILCAMNLINAAIKTKKFKDEIHYGMLKPKVSGLLMTILDINTINLDVEFYIDKLKQCAYIEIYDLQFGFHNITIYKELEDFINSPLNKAKIWKEVPLQKIAGELFDYAIKKN
ncbi:hypothetical protein ACFSJW_08555 [Flavobacterium artemisiae]|uniref:Uncharacterized protein n=2 Tax=Flavobacterium TaxID=237 RepID=A0ABW4HFA7_9FLAO|nr:hypothetical protein [Flavobacterium sp. F-65]MCC9073277.1 hypothetical protein [Flavobacterium sp. F-65]